MSATKNTCCEKSTGEGAILIIGLGIIRAKYQTISIPIIEI